MLDSDAIVIGAGPAGASASIRLSLAGWRVLLVEQSEYPRQKVCGECIAAGNLVLLDELGIGRDFMHLAGAELRGIGWMSGAANRGAEFPPCTAGPYRFGRAIGRDVFDALLLRRARSAGVRVLQPAKVRCVGGGPGSFECRIEQRMPAGPGGVRRTSVRLLSAAVIIDAHGSWEAPPDFGISRGAERPLVPRRASDLFAFKARFQGAALSTDRLSVLAFPGGYGGIVVADGGNTTLACCIRRDALRTLRGLEPGIAAGPAVEALLMRACPGVRQILRHASREAAWLSVGPIRPGIRLDAPLGVFRIGNASGESHPLIGEGISMALQSAKLLAGELTRQSVAAIDARRAATLQHRYAHAWMQHFAARLRLASLYAHVAMRPRLADLFNGLLGRWPGLLTEAARFAGKARDPIGSLSSMRGTV